MLDFDHAMVLIVPIKCDIDTNGKIMVLLIFREFLAHKNSCAQNNLFLIVIGYTLISWLDSAISPVIFANPTAIKIGVCKEMAEYPLIALEVYPYVVVGML